MALMMESLTLQPSQGLSIPCSQSLHLGRKWANKAHFKRSSNYQDFRVYTEQDQFNEAPKGR